MEGRKRPLVTMTLTPIAIELLGELATRMRRSKSGTIVELIYEEALRRGLTTEKDLEEAGE